MVEQRRTQVAGDPPHHLDAEIDLSDRRLQPIDDVERRALILVNPAFGGETVTTLSPDYIWTIATEPSGGLVSYDVRVWDVESVRQHVVARYTWPLALYQRASAFADALGIGPALPRNLTEFVIFRISQWAGPG